MRIEVRSGLFGRKVFSDIRSALDYCRAQGLPEDAAEVVMTLPEYREMEARWLREYARLQREVEQARAEAKAKVEALRRELELEIATLKLDLENANFRVGQLEAELERKERNWREAVSRWRARALGEEREVERLLEGRVFVEEGGSLRGRATVRTDIPASMEPREALELAKSELKDWLGQGWRLEQLVRRGGQAYWSAVLARERV